MDLLSTLAFFKCSSFNLSNWEICFKILFFKENILLIFKYSRSVYWLKNYIKSSLSKFPQPSKFKYYSLIYLSFKNSKSWIVIWVNDKLSFLKFN